MATSDAAEIQNMFVSSDYRYDEELDIDRQILYVNDTNKTDYNSGIVTFEIPNLVNKLTPVYLMRFRGVIKIYSSSTPFNGTESIALAFGKIGLINSIKVTTNNGQLLLDEKNLVLINYRRWLQNHAVTAFNNNINVGITDYNGTSELIDNKGFISGEQLFDQEAVFDPSSNAYYLPFDLALSDLHPLFESLDFLLFNVGLNITLTFSYASDCVWKAFNSPTATTSISYVVYSSGATNSFQMPGWPNLCRIYYPIVTPNAEEFEKISKLQQRGWMKEIEFTQNYYSYYIDTLDVSTKQHQMAWNVTLPMRLHILTTPEGWLRKNGANIISYTPTNVTATINSPYNLIAGGANLSETEDWTLTTTGGGQLAPTTFPIPINAINLYVDDEPYYQNLCTNAYERWDLVKENVLEGGESEIFEPAFDFDRFISTFAGITSLNISRLQQRVRNPMQGIPIRIEYQYGDSSIKLDQVGMRSKCLTLEVNDRPVNFLWYTAPALANAIGTNSMKVDVDMFVEYLMKIKLFISQKDVKVFVGWNPGNQ